jgi:hypothetical protein
MILLKPVKKFLGSLIKVSEHAPESYCSDCASESLSSSPIFLQHINDFDHQHLRTQHNNGLVLGLIQ